MANEEADKEKKRLKYYECNMTKTEHMTAYIVFAVVIAIVFYIFYRNMVVSLIGGLVLAVFQEKNYAGDSIKKRQNRLRAQFKEFLEIISISVSGGSGRSMENAIMDAQHELQMIFNEDADIVREIQLIVNDYQRAGIPMVQGFKEFGERSDVDDIQSFATVYATIDGKSSDFGYIIRQTHDIIKEKQEIKMEIDTGISSAKSEAYTMLVLPLVIVIAMSAMGGDGGFLGVLFTTLQGRIAATIGIACVFVSYILAVRATDIEI